MSARFFRRLFLGLVGFYTVLIVLYAAMGDWEAAGDDAGIVTALIFGWLLRGFGDDRLAPGATRLSAHHQPEEGT